MPGGRTHFQNGWLSSIDANGHTLGSWCRSGKDSYHGYCRFCDCDVHCDNSGKTQLLQHAKQGKHKAATRAMMDTTQTKLMFKQKPADAGSSTSAKTSEGQLTLFSEKDGALQAEIIWMAKLASCNFSLRSVDHLGETFAAMFPDSKIASTFSLSRTRASYIFGEGMGPYLKRIIIEDLRKSDSPFVMHFDETTNSQIKKQMDLTLRYWSDTHNEVWVAYYTSLFFGHADAETVVNKMYEQMKEDGIPVQKLCTLVRDGPNVNKSIMSKLEALIKEDHKDFPGFVNLGSCILHVVHNAFGKGLDKLQKDVEQLCMDVYSLFKYSAARREDFQELQKHFGVELHNFQQHTEVRWLSLGPAITRLLEQWDPICQFITDLGKDLNKTPKSINYKRVAALLTGKEKDNTKLVLDFVANIVPVFEEFLTIFQKSEPQIHIIYDSMCNTLCKLMHRFVKGDAVEKVMNHGSKLASLNCGDASLQLSDKDLVIGTAARESLAKIEPQRHRMFFLGIRAFLGAAVSHLQSRLPLENSLLKDLSCLNPLKRQRSSTSTAIQNVSRKLLPAVDASLVHDEWKIYQSDTEVPMYDSKQRVDHFWNNVFSLKTSSGFQKYTKLADVVRAGLVLAQMNSESERSLSVNATVVTKERSLLAERTIIGLRSVKAAIHFYDPVSNRPEKIPISSGLKAYVRSAHRSYSIRLEEEKEEERKRIEAAKNEEKMKEKFQKEAHLVEETKKDLLKKDEELLQQEKKALEELDIADELVSDGSVKLQAAMSGSDFDKQDDRNW